MKAKLIFLPVERSRLHKNIETGIIHISESEVWTGMGYLSFKPVLVSDKSSDSSDPTRIILGGDGSTTWYEVTRDTTDLYEQIAAGKLVDGGEYEFSSYKGLRAFTDPSNPEIVAKVYEALYRPLKPV
jgi:hypothetical protein